MSISSENWLALCLASESDREDEWLPLAWAIRNRVESSQYPDTYVEVILQPMQFSYFNPFTGVDSEAIFEVAMSEYPGARQPDAMSCAAWVIRAPAWERPFSHRVLHFWAPAAMDPPGTDPSWASQMKVFELPGNFRWKFAES